jgi:hypothetical protein
MGTWQKMYDLFLTHILFQAKILLLLAIFPPTWAVEHPLKIADYARLSHTSVLPVYASTKVSDPVYLYQQDTWDYGYWAGESW